jgi:hypothetical protein
MKPYIVIICLAASLAFTASAQDHKAAIKQTADLYVAAVLKQDYTGTIQYMYPGRVAYYGGKDKLIEQMQTEAKRNVSQNSKIKNILIGEPGDVVKYGATLYSVVPDAVIFQFGENTDIGGASSLVALSTDDGKSWTFATTENMPWLTSALPDVAKMNIPKPVQLGILDKNDKPKPEEDRDKPVYVGRRALAQVIVTHKEEYLTDTTGVKLLTEQGYLRKDGAADEYDLRPGDTGKYGNDAANGIIRFIIDDKKYPNAHNHIVKTMKYIGLYTKPSH